MGIKMIELPIYQTEDDAQEVCPDNWTVEQAQEAFEKLLTGRIWERKELSLFGQSVVLDQSLDGIHGYHDGPAGVNASVDAPVITFANHTCAMRFMTRPFSVIQNVFPIAGLPGKTDTRFLFYWLNGRVHLEEYKGHFPDLRRLWFPLPPLAEQRAIAGVLGALDDKIESNRRQHTLIEQLVETSFQGICENFSGEYQVMGDLVEQGVSGVWGSETQQSESEVCVTCLRGVDLNSLATGVIPSAPLRWVSAGQSASRNPQEGEIWVEASGFRCGRSVVIGSHTSSLFRQPVRNSNFVKRLTPRKSVRDSYIAWLSLRKIYASGEINNFRTGTSIRNLDVDGILKNVRVPILDDAPASQLEGLVQCLLSPGRSKESSTLESLRDALLPELLSGRLRVKDAESMMEDL